MITPAFGLTATERVLPKLALDFTTASLDSRITFTRTTGASNPATYVNSSGVITAATNNQPRFDYDPVTLDCKGLLIEESRTNSILQSSDFNNSPWTKTSITVSSNSISAPDGTLTADTLEATSTSVSVVQTVVFSATPYSISVYAKAGTANWFRIGQSATTTHGAYFDVVNGTIGNVYGAGNTASITNAGNGWYRCTLHIASPLTSGQSVFYGQTDNNNSTAVTIGKTLSLWGAQLEAGAFATSYIPTTTTALTRNADNASMTGTNFSDWFTGGATAGTFQTNFIYPNAKASGGQRFLGFNGFIGFYDTGGYLAFFDGTAQRVLGTMVASNTVKKYAIGFSGTTSSAGKNGALATAAYSSAAFAPTAMYFGYGGSTTVGELNGWIQQVYYWPQRLTNAELQAFSK